MTRLGDNLGSVRERIQAAAERAGRDPEAVTLVAVSKTVPCEEISRAYDLGLRHFGENRVEEAETKIGCLPADITWHMIGHVQGRKARRVTPLFQMVHSVDSLRLARRLDAALGETPAPLPVLLEINVSGEESKYGFSAPPGDESGPIPPALHDPVVQILDLPRLSVRGLMTMAPIVSDPELARPLFVRLRLLRDRLAAAFPGAPWDHLSMGMSDDFEVAVEEGATLVRLGRALFSPDRPAWRNESGPTPTRRGVS